MVVTVEREDVELRKSKVCRKLFVDSDDECVITNDKQDLKVELDNNFNSLLQKKIEKWNFDFVKGLPLKGRYNWTPVNKDLETSATSTVNFETSGKLRNKMNRKFHPYKNQQKKSHQTILHDFFKTIKRPSCSTTKSASSSSSSSSHTPEYVHVSALMLS